MFKMIEFKQFFNFNSGQRKGIFGLFMIIISLQLVYVFIDFSTPETLNNDKRWLSLQPQIDSLKAENHKYTNKIYPFNPNFITDFKGYKLGMTTTEIDRLLAYRKTNKYVNSAKEFQEVTKVSDELLHKISPYFKFPEWVNDRKSNNYSDYSNYTNNKYPAKEKIIVKDINQATKEDLMKVSGIGDAISDRILNEKTKFGGFVSMLQMNDIYGLSPEVIEKINENFKIFVQPNIKKLDINNADLNELKQFPYFGNGLAKKIIIYRSMNGDFKDAKNLTNVKDFPADKIQIIALYLKL
jgi:DNA uptake protein ComE-like DNA-binding protein